jgi:hypothetical protein
MRHVGMIALAFAVALSAGACKPDLGAPQSFIDGPRVLAVRANPAEGHPADMVTFEPFVVDVDGTVSDPDAAWAICNEPPPPAESNTVNGACLSIPDDATGATFSVPLPAETCTNFGPLTSKPGSRPADPDTTGGYYQPVRVTWHSGAGDLVAFQLERILCPLGGIASTDVAGAYASMYQPNNNPKVGAVTLDPDGAATPLYAADQSAPPEPATVTAGQLVTFEASWDGAIQETFKVYDLTTQELVDQTESLRLSWFATGGEFEHDRTGVTGEESDTTTRNLWRVPTTPGTVHIWVVLRDSRGGVDFASAAVEVTP